MYAVVTGHAQSRLKSRSGLNKKSVNRIADRVLNKGYSCYQLKGRLQGYIEFIGLKSPKVNTIKVYGDKAYLFYDNVLITVLQIPSELTKNMKQMIAV